MSAVDDYRDYWDKWGSEDEDHEGLVDLKHHADAAIAELEQAYEAMLSLHGDEVRKRERTDAQLRQAQWAMLEAEIARLNLICDRLAAAGHS